MRVAAAGTRSYYLTDFADEIVPCDCTLEGWAAWLAKADAGWDRHEPARDGAVFDGSSILFHEDIVATCRDGEWSLSREVGSEQFLAVRSAPGQGWSAEDLIDPDGNVIDHLADYVLDSGVLHIAVGTVEDGWRFTFNDAEPPRLSAERIQ